MAAKKRVERERLAAEATTRRIDAVFEAVAADVGRYAEDLHVVDHRRDWCSGGLFQSHLCLLSGDNLEILRVPSPSDEHLREFYVVRLPRPESIRRLL